MTSRLNAYIGFKNNARQAMEFYHSVFGGKLTLNTFKESQMSPSPDFDDNIMHAMLEGDNGMYIMAADTPPGMEYTEGTNISMSLSGDNEPELRAYWEKLSEGANIQEPLVQAPWGDIFGMLTDKFGIKWMVNISGKKV